MRFAQRSTRGLLLGLSTARCLCAGTAVCVVVLGLVAGGGIGLVASGLVWVPLLVATFVSWQGLVLSEWAPVVGHWTAREATRQSEYRARVSASRPAGTMVLPGDAAALRFVQMAERGIDTEDPHASAELCRAALYLIDDTPVGNGSGRYGWWSSMWEARIGRLATKAAGRLAELARHGVIDLELARTGIERARLAAEEEEEGELHRVAMVLEAWAGNDERVEREWQAACAHAEELEAGSVPSAATESVLVAARTRRPDEEQGR